MIAGGARFPLAFFHSPLCLVPFVFLSSRFFPLNKILFDPVNIGRTLSQQAIDRLCAPSAEVFVISSFINLSL
jgi:hypothetical protein